MQNTVFSLIIPLFLSVLKSLGLDFFALWGFGLAFWLGFFLGRGGRGQGTVRGCVSGVVGDATVFDLKGYE